jgi:hypothetical protein
MKLENEKSNVFISQMSRLFGGVSHKTPDKQNPVAPRMTCTRLRRFRETRQDIVIEPPVSPLVQTNEEGVELTEEELITKKGSFAQWLERNQQEHQQVTEKQNQFHEEVKRCHEDADKTVQGFAHFSSAALQHVATDPNAPIITLKGLAAHYDVKVRRALATNKNLGADILHILARDCDDAVKYSILDHDSLAQEEILRLCDEDNEDVASKAKSKLNPNIRPTFNHRRAMAATANIDITAVRTIRRKHG